MAAESQKIRGIVRSLRELEADFLNAHPLLDHRDAIASLVFVFSLSGAIALAVAYLQGLVHPALAVVGVALLVSNLHELEHDLIHLIYFPRRPWVQHLMFFGIWMSKQSLNPWARKYLHIQHHRHSGQTIDVEERLLGIGLRPLPLRLFLAFMPTAVIFITAQIRRDAPHFFPPGGKHRWLRRLARLVDYVFLVWPPVWIGLAIAGLPLAQDVLVISVLPHLLRHGCIALMSSYSHYYGDIEDGDVLRQNQSLRHWALWPFQLFCWNFGATHVLHHFYVAQPFYLRTILANRGLAFLAARGTRFNDFGIVGRANRFNAEKAST